MATEGLSTQPSVHTFGGEKRDASAYPLEDKWYPLKAGTPEFEFWTSQTGIKDEKELKEHILKVQAEAHAVSLIPRSDSILHKQDIDVVHFPPSPVVPIRVHPSLLIPIVSSCPPIWPQDLLRLPQTASESRRSRATTSCWSLPKTGRTRSFSMSAVAVSPIQ